MPTQARYYSSNAAKTTLAASISSSATSLTLAAASNLPSEYPYTLILEKDTANEEVVQVTSLVGSAYQIDRNIDSSGAKAHAFGANVEHGVSARDFTESRQHEVATSGHHGVTGNIVGTGGAQTLTSKTLTTPIIAGATISGAFTSTATITGGTITGATITGLSTPANTSDAATKGYIDTQTVSAAASASSASVSASSAATSASSAATSASSAATSAASALSSAATATTSAATAVTSAATAISSAATATTSAAQAATSASSASTSASSAATSAASALTSATSAAASATTAAASVATIATSASQAATSATSAATSATAAATSATSAAASATTASNSAATATTSASQAATSASSAATSASSAATSAASSLTSQSSAATSQSSAATSASSAATSQTAAATSASSASTSASSAATSATSSATSAALAASIVAGAIQGTLFDAKGDLLVGTADDAVSRLAVGANGYLLTADSAETTGVKWAAAPVSLPSQTGNAGEFLTTDGTSASWAVVAGSLAQPTEPTSPTDGQIWVDTDGTALINQLLRWSKAPAGGTTTLSGNDDNSVPLTYSVGYEQVFQNGALLARGGDYTATNGTSISLTNASVTGDIFEVFAAQPVAISDVYTQTQANAAFINDSLLTTTGDTIYASGANTPARLGIGTTGQVLSVSGGVPAWSAPTAMTVISSGTLASGGTSLTSIAQTYKDLILVLRNGYTTGGGSGVRVRINNDSSGIYSTTRIRSSSTAVYNTTNDVAFYLDDFTSGPTTSDYGQEAVFSFLDYTNTTTRKLVNFSFFYETAGLVDVNCGVFGAYKSNSAVTRIDMLPVAGTLSGTYILYGVN
jgi:hypothetical protein